MEIKKIGNFIAERRKFLGLTQNDLAEKLNVSDKAVSKWESGNGLPDTVLFPQLAKELGITTDELFAGKCEAKDDTLSGSVYAQIASGKLDLVSEMEKGLKIDGRDEYGKSLADYCAEKNNIEVFRLLVKLKKITVAHKTETRSNFSMRPSGKETITYEDMLLCDHAYFTGKYDNPYPKDYSDSALFCLVVKNREDNILQQLNLGIRAFNEIEAECIADDFNYFYNMYFVKAFPSHIGILIRKLVEKGKQKDALKLLDLIVTYKQEMERKCADCEKEANRCGKSYHWQINWNTGVINTPVYDKNSKQTVKMRDKIIAYAWGTNEQPFIIGNAILFTKEDIEDIGFADKNFLADCRKLDIIPTLDKSLLERLLKQDDVKLFEAFIEGQTLDADLERLILNSNGKIKSAYIKSNTPKSINDAISSGNIALVLNMLSTPKATVQYSKEVDVKLLGTKEMLPILKKFLPFFDIAILDKLLNNIAQKNNPEARIALIEAGAMVLTQATYPDYEGGSYVETLRDKTQTELLYKLLKSEVK